MNTQVYNTLFSSFDISKQITMSKFFSKVKLSPSSRLVLRVLIDHWNGKKGYCFPKQNTLADETGCSRKSVNNAIDELRSKGLILTTGDKGDTLKYYLTAKFFDLIEFAQPQAKTSQGGCNKISQHGTNNSKQINKNRFLNFQGNEAKYKSAEQTKKELSEQNNIINGTPLDQPKEKQIEWYYSLMPELRRTSMYALEIKSKYNLS